MNFLEKTINLKDLSKDTTEELCLLENNEKQIEQICDFLANDKKLMLINGFRGSGKSKIVDFSVSNSLSEDVLKITYNCLETTILDDMLLSFFQSFRTFALLGKITPLKIKVENFTQKINAYFHSTSKPILIILDSFDSIMKGNKNDILNFIKHILQYKNIKIIIVSKTFSLEDFDSIDYDKTTTLALTQKLFEKHLKNNGIKQIGVISNELYKLTKGYYRYVELAIKVMNLRQISLVNFLENYSKSYMTYHEFITREILSLVDPVSAHLFRLLTVMRIPIHTNLLKSLHLFDENRIRFFVDNSILSTDGECIYLKDSFREVLENQIPENVMIKLHGACVDLYNTQLPLKPTDRDLMLSRQTMRNEIEYHSMFLPKKPILPAVIETKSEQAKTQTVNTHTDIKQETIPEIEETKEEKINKISFIIEDEVVLDNIADSIKDFITTSTETSELEKASSQMSLQNILNAAKQEEQNYNYKRVVMLYQTALTKTTDDDFYTFLPTIYTKLATAYKNLSDWYEALEYFTQAQDFYENVSDKNKVSETKLEIANIYYAMYKHENAKFILTELEKTKDIKPELRIKVNLALAKLCHDTEEEFRYYEKVLPLVQNGINKSVGAELYYHYAACCDEMDDLSTAVKYYKKSIELESNPKLNPHISNAYANLADVYNEIGNTHFAIKYYNESINIDKIMKNYNGLYSSALHLAEIYSLTDENKTSDYLNKAYEYAKKLNEPYYIAQASLELGDFAFAHNESDKAFKYFMEAYYVAQNSLPKDNLDKITSRIDDIKRKVGETYFNNLQEKYEK